MFHGLDLSQGYMGGGVYVVSWNTYTLFHGVDFSQVYIDTLIVEYMSLAEIHTRCVIAWVTTTTALVEEYTSSAEIYTRRFMILAYKIV